MTKQLSALFLGLFLLVLGGCDQNRVFEENTDIPDYNWRIEDVKEFAFEIKDTAPDYQVFLNVRNAIQYEYYNLYVNLTLIGPDGEKLSTRLHEMYLMDKKTGEPLGSGAGDIFDHSILAVKNQHFSKSGIYKIRLTQYMRKNPLPGIMSIGIKVAKSPQ